MQKKKRADKVVENNLVLVSPRHICLWLAQRMEEIYVQLIVTNQCTFYIKLLFLEIVLNVLGRKHRLLTF